MSLDFKAKNTGNRIVINCATVREVQRLKKVILDELKKSPLGLKVIGGAESVFDKELDFTGIIDFVKNTLIGIDTSEEFEEAIFDCLKHCTYKTTYKINQELFDNDEVPEAREDYYEIIYTCIEENLRPFFKSLVATWKTHIQSDKLSQVLDIAQLTK